MKLVIFTIVVISLATIVVNADGSQLIIQEQLRMLQKQGSFSKGFLRQFFGPNSKSAEKDNKQDKAEQYQDLENNLDQLAKALPYQMLLPRRKNTFNSPLGILGTLMNARNQQKKIAEEEQINPLEELNQLLAGRKKKQEKKPFHWENPDFKEDKKDIPIYKIFGSKSKNNHRLTISEEQVENILANQIPAFNGGKLLKLSQASYSKGFFLNVQFLTTKNQVYKVKAKYNQQDNQLQIISMSQLGSYEEPEEQIQSSLDEEKEEEFMIEEILNQQENEDDFEVVEQNISQDIQQPLQNLVQQPAQIEQPEASVVQEDIKQKIVQKIEEKNPQKVQQAKLSIKETVKQPPLKQQKKNAVQAQKVQKILQKTDKQVKLPTSSLEEPKVAIEEPKIAEAKVQLKEKQPIKEVKKEEVKEQLKQVQPVKVIKKEDVKQQSKEKQPIKELKKEEQIKEKTVQKQPVKQQKKNQKVENLTEKKPALPVKQDQKKVDIKSPTNLQKQEKNLAKQQPKPILKASSDKPAASSIIVQN